MTTNDHNRLVGIFLLVHGLFNILIMGMVTLVYLVLGVGMTTMTNDGEQQFAGGFLLVAAFIMFFFSAVFFAPQIIGGWKVYKTDSNARVWGIVGSILATLSFPLGTAAGVYGLWFLFGDQGKNFYDGGEIVKTTNPPPPPNSWQ